MLRDLDLDPGSSRGHTGGHIRSRSTHIPNLIEIGKKTLWTYGRTDVRTDGCTDGQTHLIGNLLGHRLAMT